MAALLEHGILHIPVVARRRVVGVIARADLARSLPSDAVADPMEQIRV